MITHSQAKSLDRYLYITIVSRVIVFHICIVSLEIVSVGIRITVEKLRLRDRGSHSDLAAC